MLFLTKREKLIILAVFIAALVIVCGIGSKGADGKWFKNGDVKTWFDSWGKGTAIVQPADETPADETNQTADQNNAGTQTDPGDTTADIGEDVITLSIIDVTDELTSVSLAAPISYEKVYNVFAYCSDDVSRNLTWTLSYNDGSDSSDLSNYVVIDTTDNPMSIYVYCLRDFGKTIKLTAEYKVANGNEYITVMSGSLLLDYYDKFDSWYIQFSNPDHTLRSNNSSQDPYNLAHFSTWEFELFDLISDYANSNCSDFTTFWNSKLNHDDCQFHVYGNSTKLSSINNPFNMTQVTFKIESDYVDAAIAAGFYDNINQDALLSQAHGLVEQPYRYGTGYEDFLYLMGFNTQASDLVSEYSDFVEFLKEYDVDGAILSLFITLELEHSSNSSETLVIDVIISDDSPAFNPTSLSFNTEHVYF